MPQADVIIIGGGMAGISAGSALASQMSVIVLEAEPQIGYHATGRSAAIFIRNYGNATLRALNAAAAPFLESPADIADSSLLSARGELIIATEDEIGALEAHCDGATGLERLSAAQAVELVPILRGDQIAAAVIEWDAQDIDVDRMLAGYARHLKRQGGQVFSSAPVSAITRANGVWTVHAADTEFHAPIIINAAGAWAEQIGRMAHGLGFGLQPHRRSMAVIPSPGGHDVDRWPLFVSASEQWYAKPQSGKLLVSPADEDPVDPQDAWADDMVLAEGLHRYEQAVTTEVTRVESSWAGLRTFAPDRTPVVGFDPQAEGLFWLAGQGGYGIQTAPALADLTTALISGAKSHYSADVIAALNPARFQ